MEFYQFVCRKGYIFIDALTHLQSYTINVVDVLKHITEKRIHDRVFIGFLSVDALAHYEKYFNCM